MGIGAFGEVWKGLYQGRPVAIKCFRAQPPTGAGGASSTVALAAATAEMVAGEIRLMERVGGKPHVLPLEGVFVSRGTREVALVLPFMAHGESTQKPKKESGHQRPTRIGPLTTTCSLACINQ